MSGHPQPQGLYDPAFEHDACGVGAVINVSGKKEHRIIECGKQVLLNLHHRGAAGADETTGDGAGILIQLPDAFLRARATAMGFDLPEPGHYAAAMLFVPRGEKALAGKCIELFTEALGHYGFEVLGLTEVPRENDCLGEIARSAEPVVMQALISAGPLTGEPLERKLYMARKRAERLPREQLGDAAEDFYICSLSAKTMVYKGMFLAHQLFEYYPDLADERMASGLCLVHQRYSTNTFPSWKLAQPFRLVAHNGEFNTLSGNRNRMRARERRMVSPELGEDLTDLFPVLTPGASDSAQFDQCLELLLRAGRSLPHAVMMTVPEAFGPRYHMSTDKRAFYEYHAAIMEPWDGPAALVFTDGTRVGGTLDRNGLRPSRYVVTTDGLVVLGSEVGVIEFPPEQVQSKGRLQPGRMFLVDTEKGRILTDNEVKSRIARQKPYRRWLESNRIELRGLFDATSEAPPELEDLQRSQRAFGYTEEELKMVLAPMAANGQEALGSMGTDTPLSVLSEKPKLLFTYFKQLFAQVTNPPIDPLREGLVMSLMLFVGKRRCVLEETPEHCRQLKVPHPILTNEDLSRLRSVPLEDYKVATIPALFEAESNDPAGALQAGIERMLAEAERAIADGASLLIVSDREASAQKAAIPSLLATAALHHGLLDRGLRGEAGICVESGEPREVFHFALLCGYGANAVNPYLAFQSLADLHRQGKLSSELRAEAVVDNYIAAIRKGMLKIMSKMGISTLRSYRSAQIFECVGLNRAVIDAYFKGTTSRIGGIGLGEIAREALDRHAAAYRGRKPGQLALDYGGEYHYRCDGENHLWSPEAIMNLQHAVRRDDRQAYSRFAELVNNQARRLNTLRGLFQFKDAEKPIPIEQVEPASEIVKRFYTGAMSHGSISAEAHEALAVGMNRLGAMANTGEGGEDPARYQLRPNGDSANCRVKQVASGRFGVTMNYLAHADVIQIKMAQGAKPGEGGHLPGHKVTEEIAKLRHSMPGVSLISPPPHHDIYSIEDLAQLIFDLKCACPGVKVSVKLVAEVGVGTVAAGVAKGNADEVLISGHDGGTGASPLTSIKYAGCPWELGLAETQQTLVLNGLRDRILVQTDGQMKTGRDVVIGALLGAERFGFGTSALVSLGCIMMRKCHHGTCPVGVATQRPELRAKFAGLPEHLERYLLFVAEEIRELMARLGFKTFDEMVGRIDCLQTAPAVEHWKAKGLDFSAVLARPATADPNALRCTRRQSDHHKGQMDWELIEAAGEAIDDAKPITLQRKVHNTDRAVGAILSNRIVNVRGPEGLPDGTLTIKFTGSAGQSFGAYLAPGVTLHLVGDANDYVGKGLSGGRIIVQTPPRSPFEAHENIIVGNTLLYGATAGEVFINGVAGERFAVRNSGVHAVVEGVGDHGCEYMTNGRVVVLGATGRNFAAGMSGGIAYVFDEHQLFDTMCNLDMVDLESVYQEDDVQFLRERIQKQYDYTGSRRAQWMLEKWDSAVGRFVKVVPIDYRKALQRIWEREQRHAETSPATEEVFHG